MHVVIVTSCELARESLMGVRPCQVKVQSACWHCWHCCCQVCPFSVFSKMPHLLRFSLQFDSTNTTKLQDLDVWFFFLLSARPRAQEDSFKVEGHSGRQEGRGEARGTSSRKRIEETSISLPMTRLLLGSWGDVKNHCGWPDCSWGREAQSNVPDAALHAAKTNKNCRWVFVLRWNVWNGCRLNWNLEVASVQSWQAWSVILKETCAWCRGIAWTSQQRQWTTTP